MKNNYRTLFLFINTLLLCAALVIISTNSYQEQGRTFIGAIIKIVCFYTIETNLLIAITMTAILLFSRARWGQFFGSTCVITAIGVYILIVGLVYATVLKGICQLTGMFKLADILLHEVSLVTYLFYWIFFCPERKNILESYVTLGDIPSGLSHVQSTPGRLHGGLSLFFC